MATRLNVEVVVLSGDVDPILLGAFEAVKQVVADNGAWAVVTAIDLDDTTSYIPSSSIVGGSA